MPSYTLAAIKEARDRVRQDMIDEQNAMYGTNLVTPQHLNGMEVEARLQTYLQYGLTLDELEPVGLVTGEPELAPAVTPETSDTD